MWPCLTLRTQWLAGVGFRLSMTGRQYCAGLSDEPLFGTFHSIPAIVVSVSIRCTSFRGLIAINQVLVSRCFDFLDVRLLAGFFDHA